MTTDSEPSTRDQRPSRGLSPQNNPRNTVRTPANSDSAQIQDLDAENGQETAQNGSKRARKPAKRGGPKTNTGKEIAVRNNTRHGILSSNPVIPGVEKPREWKAHLEGVYENLEPVGHLEQQFARRVAMALWQLARLDRYVAAVTAGAIENAGRDETVALPIPSGLEGIAGPGLAKRRAQPGPSPEELARTRDERIIPRNSELKKIIRYEAHLHRIIDRNLRALEALQSKRLGVKVNLHRQL